MTPTVDIASVAVDLGKCTRLRPDATECWGDLRTYAYQPETQRLGTVTAQCVVCGMLVAVRDEPVEDNGWAA